MLHPSQRRHLMDALRPPPGFSLDRALGTTYSLDLLALLTAPLAFTLFDYETAERGDNPIPDPIALLDALRRYADRMAICCDAGRIAVPLSAQLLYSNLEPSVYELSAPNGGVFHPKLWLLRFSGPDATIMYRLLCLSRNLTFDRSWDTALVLDGIFHPDTPPDPTHAPLAAFVAGLPGLVVQRRSTNALAAMADLIAAELPQVTFELPPGFDQLAFYPLGMPNLPAAPFDTPVERTLVIAPFVSANRLRMLADYGRANILVARLEDLQEQPEAVLRSFAAVYTLSEAADLEDPSTEDDSLAPAPLSGLHAKLYVSDAGERAHVWTGSANATDAAFQQNVEFLVRLSGPRTRCGIAAVLGEDHTIGLRTLLEPFDPAGGGQTPDPVQTELDALVETWQRRIARLGLTAQVSQGAGPEQFTVQLCLPQPALSSLPPHMALHCWPTTRGAGSAVAVRLDQPEAARFGDLSYVGLTSFFAFALTARVGATTATARFVLNLPLLGAPADRPQRILRELLQNRAQVLRFLFLLLADSGDELESALHATRTLAMNGVPERGDASIGVPLFEALVRALDRDPARIDQVAHLVDDLRASPETSRLLPDDFDAIWTPIRIAAQEVRQ